MDARQETSRELVTGVNLHLFPVTIKVINLLKADSEGLKIQVSDGELTQHTQDHACTTPHPQTNQDSELRLFLSKVILH